MRKAPQSRAIVALALGVALPTVLLGVGWLFASLRERHAREEHAHARIEGAALAIRSAVDESLDELLRREDARPFYLYNHFYVPEDVLAISDAVLVSPLASPPEDPRVVGHFQIDPDESVRTPYASSASDPPTECATRVLDTVRAPELAWLPALLHGGAPPPVVAAIDPTPPSRSSSSWAWSSSAPSRDLPPIAAAPPSEGATVTLNSYGNLLATDISQAQSGDRASYERVQSRGRSAPITERRTVEPTELQQQRASVPMVQGVDAIDRPDATPRLVPETIEVEYTPMELHRAGDRLVLHRLVSHEGTTVVQGVVLDLAQLTERWIPDVAARHAAGNPVPTVVDSAQAGECALARSASDRITGVSLCFDAAALAAETAGLDTELWVQLAALAGLLGIVLLAIVLVHRTARRAESLSRQKSAFVSAVSHELRTPLTTIRMHAEMLSEDLVDDERRPRVYDELVGESVRLSRLVENVLEISRLEEGLRPLRATRGDLASHVREVASSLRRQVEGKGFTLEVRLPDDPVELAFDAQAVEQVVGNLIENALKYAASASDKRIEIEVKAAGARASVVVRDHGPGIPTAERERVFDRFYRIERADTAHKPGTGIGLALVRELARAHGGDATAHERDGGGAEIRVSLPIG